MTIKQHAQQELRRRKALPLRSISDEHIYHMAHQGDPTTILVPEKCPVCQHGKWRGGSQVPGKPFRYGLRVWYSCGSQMLVEQTFPVTTDEWRLCVRGCEQYRKVK